MNLEQTFILSPISRSRAIAMHIGAIVVLSASVIPSMAAVVVDSSAQTDSLSATNGNKVAVSGGRLYMVYTKGGAIYYSSSANSQFWSVPFTLPTSGGGVQPAIAAANGIVGIVFHAPAGDLQYLWCKPARANSPCTFWKGPYSLGFSGVHPSIAAYQTDMYVTAASGGIVTHKKFASTITAPLVPFSGLEYVFYDSGTCLQHTVDFPSITVLPVPSANSPEVRVSWLQKSMKPTCLGAVSSIGVHSAKRNANGSWTSEYFYPAVTVYVNPQMYSLSSAANANTGEQFIAASFGANNSPVTMLFRRDTTGAWSNSTLLYKASQIDIDSDGSTCHPQGIRIAYTVAPSGYGNTFYQTGPWGNLGAPVPVNAAGTSPQALFFYIYVPTGIYASLYDTFLTPVFYARSNGGVESVEVLLDKATVQQCMAM